MSRSRTDLLSLLAMLLVAGALESQGLPPVPVPAGNPITADKALLGKTLFWDEQLSSTRTVACATCHIPSAGGADPRSRLAPATATHPGADAAFGTDDDVIGSPGVPGNAADGRYLATAFGLEPQVTGRKVPSMINAAYAPLLFWDGRATDAFVDPGDGTTVVLAARAALESQAAGPPLSDVEMGHFGRDWPDVVARVERAEPLALATDLPGPLAAFVGGRDYPALFALAFGTPDVTPARIAMAIATYERTLISDRSAWDLGTMTVQQQQGELVFFLRGRCSGCHAPPLFTSHGFFNIGVRPPGEDRGRAGVTGLAFHENSFKAPSLRNVALRAPYFHNGSKATLRDVVEFYDRGGDFDARRSIAPLGLTADEKAALVAFLEALTDPRVAAEQAPFDRPRLYTETARVPERFGAGSAGSGGIVPRAIALEPAVRGNPNLTLAVSGGLGGAAAVLVLDRLADRAGTALLGIDVHVARTPDVFALRAGSLSGSGPGAGFASLVFDVPDRVDLVGARVFGQWVVADPGVPAGLAASDAFGLEVFDRLSLATPARGR